MGFYDQVLYFNLYIISIIIIIVVKIIRTEENKNFMVQREFKKYNMYSGHFGVN